MNGAIGRIPHRQYSPAVFCPHEFTATCRLSAGVFCSCRQATDQDRTRRCCKAFFTSLLSSREQSIVIRSQEQIRSWSLHTLQRGHRENLAANEYEACDRLSCSFAPPAVPRSLTSTAANAQVTAGRTLQTP